MDDTFTSSPSLTEDVVATFRALSRLAYFLASATLRFSTWAVTFATLTLPRVAYSVLSWGAVFTLQLNFTKVAITVGLGATILSYVWKVRYLNRYTYLKEVPLAKDDENMDLHPDIVNDQAQPGFHNYLDEFLSAIKVFGYLEKPVFHELARHLQTRRLVAGDTLNLDADKSFYIVVDGQVQVFAQTGITSKGADAYDDEDDNGYQLLNNVESGGTLSSLFTILSLFTEDVKLRYEEDRTAPASESGLGAGFQAAHDRQHARRVPNAVASRFGHDEVPDFELDENELPGRVKFPPGQGGRSPPPRSGSSHSFASASTLRHTSSASDDTVTEVGDDDGEVADDEELGNKPSTRRPSASYFPRPLDPIYSAPGTPGSTPGLSAFARGGSSTRAGSRSRMPSGDASPDTPTREGTIARATTDTTLAVIPAEAFRRLTHKFPNAAAHIVQVILTRLQRVTFLTAHKYLGLTREVIRTEKAINELACYPLPDKFWETGGIHRLRQRFVPETKMHETETPVEEKDYFTLDTPFAGPRMGEVFWGNDNSQADQGIKLKVKPPTRRGTTRKAGDLLTMSTPITEESRILNFSALQTPRLERGQTAFDDFDLRDGVMECISKAIGLSQTSSTPGESANASPLLRPQDGGSSSRSASGGFGSSYASLSLLGLHGFDDESSMAGSSISNFQATELENEVEILFFPKGTQLVKEGERNAGLYYVIEGFLDVSMPKVNKTDGVPMKKSPNAPTREGVTKQGPAPGKPRRSTSGPGSSHSARPPPIPRTPAFASIVEDGLPPLGGKNAEDKTSLFTVKPGGIAGYLSSLSGFPSYVDITAKTDCYVGLLPAKALERIMDRRPIVLLTLAKRLISLLSPLVLHIDSALDWMHVSAGEVIYRKDDPSDAFYIVINGRLRSIQEKPGGGVDIVSEHGQGESVGELDCITASPRPSTLHAIRDSELVRLPMALWNAISVRHPSITISVTRLIASRLRDQVHPKSSLPMTVTSRPEMGRNNLNLKTVAIIPTTRSVPVNEFATKMLQALQAIGAPTGYLNQATVMQVLGRHAFSRIGTLKLAGWLAETEQKYRIVLYVADTAVSAPWTQTCIRQADCIFLVADAGADPELGEYEKALVGMKTTARKELVLLHADRNVPSGSTRIWLKNRPWIHAHHHVEMAGATPQVAIRTPADAAPVVALRKLAKRVEVEIGKYRSSAPRAQPTRSLAMDDFARLARRLCGKSIGVVLGGGGARGISHIGVLQALNERGIPIDMVGGTSIGSFVGGLYAREGDLVSTYGRAKRFAGRMSTLWRILTDLTYPVVAYTTGHEFNRGIYKSFYDVHIEDMWIPFFCNTTNITHSRMDIHKSGYAWRYIRASMSLAGLLPPLCDKGDMLVDGGYVDNLPVSVMLDMGAASVFAVDVGSVDDTSPRNYGESVSGWWLLLQRWNPFAEQQQIPNITEIQSRLTYVSSVKTLEEAKATPGVLYLRMPVTMFGTMEFGRFLELFEIGTTAGKKLLDEFEEKGMLPTGMESEVVVGGRQQTRGQKVRRNSI